MRNLGTENIVRDWGVVAVLGEILRLQQQNWTGLHQADYDQYHEKAKYISEFADGERQGQYACPDDCLHDGGDGEQEI